MLSNALKYLTGGTTEQVVLTLNYAPYDLALSADTISENEAIGTFIGRVSVEDLNVGDVHTYAIASGDSAYFSISNDSLFSAVVFDYEDSTSFEIAVTATDSAGLSYTENFTIAIVNDPTDDVSSSIDWSALTGVQVFPNPFSDAIFVEGITAEAVTVEVFDFAGRRVFQEVYPRSNSIRVSLGDLPTGVYYARLSAESRTKTVKLIKE